ncbi:MAG: hypothetical protein IPG04_40860 [Polyangiaceae bacterium]|nr:hypothetical protein [Polyangiaceae bacterium]
MNIAAPKGPGKARTVLPPIPNKAAGAQRGKFAKAELQQTFPEANVQSEVYLRTKDAKIAKDPLTDTGRRIDLAVIEDQSVLDLIEVTSLTAPKAPQIAKERRIREAGGVYIRDRETGQLLTVSEVVTRLWRKP